MRFDVGRLRQENAYLLFLQALVRGGIVSPLNKTVLVKEEEDEQEEQEEV